MAQSHNFTGTVVESDIPVYKTIGDRTSDVYDDIEMQTFVSKINVNVENDEEKLPDKKHKILLKKNVCIGIIAVITVLVIVSAVVAYVFLSPKTQGGSCKAYTYIRNGQIISSTGSRHGDTLEFQCDKNSKLIGTNTITCLSSNVWSADPHCVPKECGKFVLTQHMAAGSDANLTTVGSVISLFCEKGFQLSGNSSVICQTDEEWSENPRCKDVDCGPPKVITNSQKYHLEKTTYDSSFNVGCVDGYSLIGTETVKCNHDGQWSDLPVCEIVSCGIPKIPAHASITNLTGTSFQSTVTVKCEDGYSMHGNSESSCTSSAKWTDLPSCKDSCQSHPCDYGNCRPKGYSIECLCFLGYTGLYCENEIDECATQPCLNGSCIDLVNGYSCSCFAGFSGIHCQTEINECVSNPCLHGTCTDLVNGYNCTCFAGYSGLDCQTEINECVSNPCLHGTCTDLVNGYNCTCFAGYSGLDCRTDINECGSNPCLQGSCTDLVDGYNCTCFAGYSGFDCQTDTDECSPDPCIHGTCIDGIGNYSCSCNDGFSGTDCEHDNLITDCVDILRNNGSSPDGIYTVRTWKSHQLINVYCDMTTDGGGWTVFQNRFDGSIDFYRNFSEYEGGFGNLTTEFWLGLSNIRELASQGQTKLRIDLEAANGTKAYETFESFYLSSGPAYTLHLGSTSGSSGISFQYPMIDHNGYPFSTYDHDADSFTENCAITCRGAWWYDYCYSANLNGLYLIPGTNDRRSMNYLSFLPKISLKRSKMMMRRA